MNALLPPAPAAVEPPPPPVIPEAVPKPEVVATTPVTIVGDAPRGLKLISIGGVEKSVGKVTAQVLTAIPVGQEQGIRFMELAERAGIDTKGIRPATVHDRIVSRVQGAKPLFEDTDWELVVHSPLEERAKGILGKVYYQKREPEKAVQEQSVAPSQPETQKIKEKRKKQITGGRGKEYYRSPDPDATFEVSADKVLKGRDAELAIILSQAGSNDRYLSKHQIAKAFLGVDSPRARRNTDTALGRLKRQIAGSDLVVDTIPIGEAQKGFPPPKGYSIKRIEASVEVAEPEVKAVDRGDIYRAGDVEVISKGLSIDQIVAVIEKNDATFLPNETPVIVDRGDLPRIARAGLARVAKQRGIGLHRINSKFLIANSFRDLGVTQERIDTWLAQGFVDRDRETPVTGRRREDRTNPTFNAAGTAAIVLHAMLDIQEELLDQVYPAVKAEFERMQREAARRRASKSRLPH